MDKTYLQIKDQCRKDLLQYLEKAISAIPEIKDREILDAGCGSGVPTLFIAEKLGGNITAFDPDTASVNFLREKVNKLNLSDKINVFRCSLSDIKTNEVQFDLILAEGLLNVIGFQQGFLTFLKLLKKKGFIIIHDEFSKQKEKIEFIEQNHCKVVKSFVLDEQVWWNNYYKCLEKQIASASDKELLKLFDPDLKEINMLKKNPDLFMSVYYIIEKM